MICPRCDSDKAEKMVSSPVGNVREVYVCRKCWLSWRSMEDPSITDPARYNRKLKITDEMIQNIMIVPPIPPLKESSE